MDEKYIEQASRISEAVIDSAIALARRQQTAPPPNWDNRSCTICEDEIPSIRLRYNFHTCVSCQSKIEIRQRLTRR